MAIGDAFMRDPRMAAPGGVQTPQQLGVEGRKSGGMSNAGSAVSGRMQKEAMKARQKAQEAEAIARALEQGVASVAGGIQQGQERAFVAGEAEKNRQFQSQRDLQYQGFQRDERLAGEAEARQTAETAHQNRLQESEATIARTEQMQKNVKRYETDINEGIKVQDRQYQVEQDRLISIQQQKLREVEQARANMPTRLANRTRGVIDLYTTNRRNALAKRSAAGQIVQRLAFAQLQAEAGNPQVAKDMLDKMRSGAALELQQANQVATSNLLSRSRWQGLTGTEVGARLEADLQAGGEPTIEAIQKAIVTAAAEKGLPVEMGNKIVGGFFGDMGKLSENPPVAGPNGERQFGFSIPNEEAAAFSEWLGANKEEILGAYEGLAARAGDPGAATTVKHAAGQLEETLDQSLRTYHKMSGLANRADADALREITSGDLKARLEAIQSGQIQPLLDHYTAKYKTLSQDVLAMDERLKKFDPLLLGRLEGDTQAELTRRLGELDRIALDIRSDPNMENRWNTAFDSLNAWTDQKRDELGSMTEVLLPREPGATTAEGDAMPSTGGWTQMPKTQPAAAEPAQPEPQVPLLLQKPEEEM